MNALISDSDTVLGTHRLGLRELRMTQDEFALRGER